MNFSLHGKIEYFKNNNCFPSILNLFFQLMRLFRNDFQRNVQHSIHTSDITKRNSNVHFILGNTVHAWPGLTVNILLGCYRWALLHNWLRGKFMRRSTRNFNIPPPGKPRAFELLKIGSFKFPPPRAKMVFKCPTLSSDLSVKCPS